MASITLSITIFVCFTQASICLHLPVAVWPGDDNDNILDLNRSVYLPDRDQLYIGATNNIYHLQCDSLLLLNKVATGPFNATTDDYITVLVTNITASGETYVTSCSSTRPYCAQRNISDVSVIEGYLRPPVLATGAAILPAVKTETGPNRKVDYTFFACPHSTPSRRSSDASGDACHLPGLSWREYDRGDFIDKSIRFKPSSDTDIVTDKYIGSAKIGKFRIFFSIQRNKITNKYQSRVAQICQFRQQRRPRITTEFTYADMIMKCGNYTKMTDVEKYDAVSETLFIITFSNEDMSGSAVCVYTFAEMKAKLVENIKDCYNNSKIEGRNDYVYQQAGRCSSSTGSTATEIPNENEDYFLCNKDLLPLFFSVIGRRSLAKQPVVKFDQLNLLAVTVTMVGAELVAFLATDQGDIRKAVVYPVEKGRQLDWVAMVANRELILPDMFIDREQNNVYAMTSFKVAKIPVETCSDYAVCGDCLSSRDPHCGWCAIENRCTRKTSCSTTWIAAAPRDSSCPELDIDPNVTSVTTGQYDARVTLSVHLPELQNVQCLFHLEDTSLGGSSLFLLGTSTARDNRDNWREFKCTTPDFTTVRNKIHGSANVTVSILTHFSAQYIAQGKLTVYDCLSFESCSECQRELWSCNWCVYDNRCVQDIASCSQDFENNQSISCPMILGIEENSSFTDVNHTLYLPVHEDLDILIYGQDLPKPIFEIEYTCKIKGVASQQFRATWKNSTQIVCQLIKEYYQLQSRSGRQISHLHVLWGNSSVDGQDIPVVVYSCPDMVPRVYNQVNCDKCKSLQVFETLYHCQWCGNQCVYSHSDCQTGDDSGVCPVPSVITVSPMKIHMNSPQIQVDISGVNLGSSFNETIDSVVIGNQTCTSLKEYFIPSERLSCLLEAPGKEGEADLTISLTGRETFRYNKPIVFKESSISTLSPNIGPLSGGTLITLSGRDLDVGRVREVFIGNRNCTVVFGSVTFDKLVCITTSSTTTSTVPLDVSIVIDGFFLKGENATFSYVDDPVITSIQPRKSFNGGGRRLTISGTNLHAIQNPHLYTYNIEDGRVSNSEACDRDDINKVIYCPTPQYPLTENDSMVHRYRKREAENSRENWLIGFKMDGVQSVRNLPDSLARIVYVENPNVIPFDSTKKYAEVLIIKGERMALAASQNDVGVNIGREKCNITGFSNQEIVCHPPPDKPEFNKSTGQNVPIEVRIGYILYPNVGELDYGPKSGPAPGLTEERSKEYIIAGTVLGVLAIVVVILIVAVIVIQKKKKVTKMENEKLMHQMENLEASVSKQCREEFAALQTTMLDLTSDLEGGNILFRDYDVYACRVLFTDTSNPVMTAPFIMNDNVLPAMEAFKGLLKNKEFLLIFIKTLERQQSFTIQDRSNLASLMMAIHDDNMEYVTDIMKTLLNDLIDQTVAAQRTKLLLRRSECVVEKLVTHWLSICLYHYLKEHAGSALFILYKAIKVQVEKGPLDYITGCAKYTLSEAKLFKAGDAEINAKALALHVHHFDYISNKDHNLTVQVLDCDTVTQSKSKLLDVLYNNVPFSQRPNVHKTLLEIKEPDRTSRMLHDEDASNEKDGIWKRLNTLNHYSVEDGAKVELSFSAEKDISKLAENSSPDSFIVGSLKRSKQVMRTISGSNFWHLTKQHRSDEMQLSSDIFLPRLLNTKGTLQKYIDDFFDEMFHVGEEPQLIIKYLFDFLDGAATRHGITDPDVLHTWKCNSLLLRFWVNLTKNPEFVFDIHKPNIVDSCLSVITQTLMDSCSTSALRLGKDSPSNKLLFAKDIPRYKDKVKRFFQEIKERPSVSDQDLNCYLTEKVSQKFGDRFYASSALLEVYKYASKYQNEIIAELRAFEIPTEATSAQNHETPLLLKIQQVYSMMATCNSDTKLNIPGSTTTRKNH